MSLFIDRGVLLRVVWVTQAVLEEPASCETLPASYTPPPIIHCATTYCTQYVVLYSTCGPFFVVSLTKFSLCTSSAPVPWWISTFPYAFYCFCYTELRGKCLVLSIRTTYKVQCSFTVYNVQKEKIYLYWSGRRRSELIFGATGATGGHVKFLSAV